jgi:hypothetical protein
MNMRWIVRSDWRCGLSLVFVFLAGIGLCACTGMQKPQPSPALSPALEAELSTWQEGLQAFEAGDYEKARVLFEMLSENAANEGLRGKAFFALASTRLVLAQNAEEFNQALATWDCWRHQFPHRMEGEDPGMLTPFLQRLTPPGSLENQTRENQVPVKKVIISGPAGCKDLLQAKDKEIERVKARLDAKEKEARRLKHQIESLEAIHLKFQERKQGVASP